MIEEIEIGDYVRTDYGISKVIPKANGWVTNKQVTLDLYNGIRNASIFKKIITKHSKNIIDLIEVGDYVNGLYVYGLLDYGLDVNMFRDAHEILEEKEIKSIVTKEQFKNIEYRLES